MDATKIMQIAAWVIAGATTFEHFYSRLVAGAAAVKNYIEKGTDPTNAELDAQLADINAKSAEIQSS